MAGFFMLARYMLRGGARFLFQCGMAAGGGIVAIGTMF